MKKMKWILLTLAGLLAITGVGGAFVAKSWLATTLSRESIVHQLETQWNCRADIASVNVSLSTAPASIEIKTLALAQRDADAEANTPMANRKAVAPGSTMVSAERALLEIDLAELIHQRLHIKRLTLSGVSVRNDVSEEKGNLLADLFSKPRSVTPPPAPPKTVAVAPSPPIPTTPPAAEPKTPPQASTAQAPEPSPEKSPEKPKHKAAFQANALGLGVVIDEARLERGSFHEVNHVTLNRTDVSDLNFALTEVDIDPSDLAHHNRAKLQLTAHVQTKGRAKIGNATKNQDVDIADFTFDTNSAIQPIDAETGDLAPAGTLDLLLKKGSKFGGMPASELGGSALDGMKKNWGLDLADLPIGGAILEDANVSVAILGPRVQFTKDARFVFADYAATLKTASWLNPAEDLIEMAIQLVPNDKLSTTLIDAANAKVGEGVVKFARQVLRDDQGHLAFDFVLSKRLTKPKMDIGGEAGTIINAVKGLGGGLLKGLIKQ